jgi:hypothetical protein
MLDRSNWKRRIYHYGLGAGLPISVVRGVADRMDEMANSRMVQTRRRAARDLLARVKPPVRITSDNAYAMISPKEFPEIPQVVALSKEIVEQRRKELPPLKGQATFWHLIQPGDLTSRYRPLLDFAVSDGMLAMVSDHLGMVPRLLHLDVWLSPPMPNMVGSHRYHLDKPDGEILSVFININDVGPKEGPFTFLPADVSKEVCRKTRYDLIYYRGGKRLEDADVEQAAGSATPVQLKGPSGTGGIVNTSRCLHLGSRCTEPRIVLAIKYALAHKVMPSYAAMFAGHPYGGDPLRSLVLEGSAPAN